jgi:hypothetical protein
MRGAPLGSEYTDGAGASAGATLPVSRSLEIVWRIDARISSILGSPGLSGLFIALSWETGGRATVWSALERM